MLDFHTVAEFSRANCLAICAFLVPINLISTLVTIILTALRRPTVEVLPVAGVASLFAGVMVLHVYSWFAIGVVMAPTYVLMSLATTCLLTNVGAFFLHRRWTKTLRIKSEAA
jgi:hypothetical protein